MTQVLGPFYPKERPDEVSGLWVWPGPAPSVIAIWGVNQLLEGFFHSIIMPPFKQLKHTHTHTQRTTTTKNLQNIIINFWFINCKERDLLKII